MKLSGLTAFVALVVCLFGCSHGPKESAVSQTASTSASPRRFETLTGQVVKVDQGYRFKPTNNPEHLLRFTHAKKSSEFVAEEFILRKYFGKTLVVRGHVEGEWLAEAAVTGQWLHPGEPRGSTLTGPEPQGR
jgi:hypothetical protein